MTCCDKNECKVTPQLCVDASIFVPEDECVCYATAILFDSMTLEDTWDPELPENQLSTLAVVPSSITYFGDLLLGTDVVATISVTAANSPDLASIVISNPTITGFDVAFGGPNIFFVTNDPLACYVSLLYGDGNFTITPSAGNPPMTFLDNSSSPQGPYFFDIRFFGVLIGQFQFTMFQPTPTTWSFTALLIDNLSSYPGIDTVFNNDAVEVRCINDTEVDVENTQAENIGAAALVLNLRANSNVIGPCDADDSLKRGIYRLCLAYKPWNIGCGCTKWEIREIVEFVLCDERLKAYWGCSTSKAGQRIRGCEDRATLIVGNLEIQASGNPSDVFRNVNDFVLTIRNVFQTFSAIGPFGSLDSFVISSVPDAPVPFPPTTLIPNVAINNTVAKLANSRLYIALKYDCPNSRQYCPDPQNLDDFRHQQCDRTKNCCVGSLSPFKNADDFEKNENTTSVFINKELTNLQDHLFQNSRLSREATVCLTPDCLKKVNCSKKREEKPKCECGKPSCEECKPKCGCGQPKCSGCKISTCYKPKCGECKPSTCAKPKCGCGHPSCGGCKKSTYSKPKCGCGHPKCGGCKKSTYVKSKCECGHPKCGGCKKSTYSKPISGSLCKPKKCDKSFDTESTSSETTESTSQTTPTASSWSKTKSSWPTTAKSQSQSNQSTASTESSSWPSTAKPQSSHDSDTDSFYSDESECRCGKKNCNKCNKKRNNSPKKPSGCKTCNGTKYN